MSDNNVVPRFFENPQNRLRHTFLTNWTRGDVVVALITGTTTFALLFGGYAIVALLFSPILVGFNVRAEYGRLWSDIWSSVKDIYIGSFLGDTMYLRDDLYPDVTAESGLRRWFQLRNQSFQKWLRGRKFRRRSRRAVFTNRVAYIQAAGEELGIVRQTDRHLDHIFIAVEGSDFSTFDHEQKYAVTNDLAELINQVNAQSSLTVGISPLRSTRPFSEIQTSQFFASNGQPIIFDPDRFELDEGMRTFVENAMTTLRQLPATHAASGLANEWALCVVTIRRTGGMRKAVAGGLSDKEIYDLPLIELGRMMVDAINSSGLNARNVHCMSFHELCLFMRAAWDVTNLDFHEFVPPERIEFVSSEDLGHPAANSDYVYRRSDLNTVKNALRYYPRNEISVGHDWVCMDGNWISTIRITKGKERFPVEQMQSLYHESSPPGVWTTAASVGEVISGTAETNTIYYMHSFSENMNNAFRSGRVVQHPKVGKKRRKYAQREDIMSRSSYAEQYNELRVVVATSLEELVRQRKLEMGRIKSLGLGCKVVTGKSRQLRAADSGLFGTNKL